MSLSSLWVEQQNFEAAHVVIVGLGEGHHVRAWLEANPQSRVTVIDSRPGFEAQFRGLNGDLFSRVNIVIAEDGAALLSHAFMAEMIHELPPVLCFEPGFGSAGETLREFFRLLTGRNREGLEFYLRRFGFSAHVEESRSDRLLTIKDLGLVIDSANEGHPLAPAVRVLRELIA